MSGTESKVIPSASESPPRVGRGGSGYTSISKESLDFLRDLAANNNRDWFQANKPRYQTEHKKIIQFADALLAEVRKHDLIETPTGKKSLHRIYRDTRFSKDKRPYKTHWSGGFRRATTQLRGGYYFHIQPGDESVVAGGFWGPNPADLRRIRDDIAADASELRTILADPTFIETFGELWGDEVKTAPKGFSRDHPDIDLIRKKQFLVIRRFTDKQVLAGDFLHEADLTFQRMRLFFDYMSEVLTTDANGAPLF